MVAKTGDETLDQILGGGIPDERSIVVTGGPGTGKSTLAMQFLQEGLERGEQCLFISTEQTVPELRDSFAAFDFDLDDEDLTITSLHAMPGEHFDQSTDEELTLTDLEGRNVFAAEFPVPFRPRYVRRFLDRFGPVDRVVFDSVSGLRPMSGDPSAFRRAVLDLVRLFTDAFGATTVFTAEADEDRGDPKAGIEYAVHGVIRVRQAPAGRDIQKFLRVSKLRGVDHDTREYGVVFDGGFEVVSRAQPAPCVEGRMETGIEGVDELLDGGLVRGATTALLHDGRATLDEILATTYYRQIEAGAQLVLVPHATMTPDRVAGLVADFRTTLTDLLDRDDLLVVDAHDAWNLDHENVMTPAMSGEQPIRDVFDRISRERDDRPIVLSKNLAALHQTLEDAKLRDLRYWLEGEFIREDDVVVDIVNERSLPEMLVEFYVDAARQCLRTWVHDTGAQVLAYEKGPGECVGSTRFVEFVDEPPFVRVRPAD